VAELVIEVWPLVWMSALIVSKGWPTTRPVRPREKRTNGVSGKLKQSGVARVRTPDKPSDGIVHKGSAQSRVFAGIHLLCG